MIEDNRKKIDHEYEDSTNQTRKERRESKRTKDICISTRSKGKRYMYLWSVSKEQKEKSTFDLCHEASKKKRRGKEDEHKER